MKTKAIAIALSAALLTCPAALAQSTGDAEFGERVREYLLANPEVLVEMQTALEQKQQEAARVAQTQALAERADLIFDSDYNIVLGNPDGDVTVVEFFDYNCGFCRRAMDDMEAVIEADPNVRFVLKEFPILGPSSVDAHIVSLAVAEAAPEQYDEFHKRLLSAEGQVDGDAAVAIAGELGIDEQTLRAASETTESDAAFAEAYELANALQITGTPSYVIGDEVVFGAQGARTLLEYVERARAVDDASN